MSYEPSKPHETVEGRYHSTIDYSLASEFSGYSIDIINKAVNSGELKTFRGTKFRKIDLASWVEELRFRNIQDSDSAWKKNLFEYGAAVIDEYIPEPYIKNLLLAYEQAKSGDPRYILPTYEYNIYRERTIWRYLRLFNIDIIDEIIFGWDTIHKIAKEIFFDNPYKIDQIALICKKPKTSPVLPHSDIITIIRDNLLHPAVLISVDLTLVEGSELFYIPKSHRIQPSGRMLSLPTNFDQFCKFSSYISQVKIHNSGIIHCTKIHNKQDTRLTFYITLCSEDAGSVRTRKYKQDNADYTFNT